MTDELDEITEKELLADISMQLEEVRHHLRELNPDVEREEIGPESQYKCNSCGSTVEEHNQAQHLIEHHNAPQEIAVGPHFTEQ